VLYTAPLRGRFEPAAGIRSYDMPKMKTSRAAAKRFKLTGSGRVRRPTGGGQHGMIGKSRRRRRRLRDNGIVSPALERRVKLLLPYL
jgi:large subunit ribosomal protein L35